MANGDPLDVFERAFTVAWGDLDANNHLANTSYLNYAAQTRFAFFAEHGFTPEAFAEAAIGPAVLEDRISYRRELRFMDACFVQFSLAAMSDDGARFTIINRILNADRKLSAQVTSFVAWFDLRARKIAPPPAELFAAMQRIPREPDFKG